MWRHTNAQNLSITIYSINSVIFAIRTSGFISSYIANSFKLTWLAENFILTPILFILFGVITVYYVKKYQMNIAYSIIVSIFHSILLPFLILKSHKNEWWN